MTFYNNSNGGSSTMVLELPSYPEATKGSRPSSTKNTTYINTTAATTSTARTLSSATPPPPEGQLPSPTTAVPQLVRWNQSWTNIYRLLATFWSFIMLGANDASYGALIPYLESYYNINYTMVSLVFLSPAVGYITVALTNNMLHTHFGQRGVAVVMSGSQLAAYIIVSQHPPYPVLVIAFILAGAGCGLGDSAWNAWIGDMANANELLGFLHAFYGLGAALAPLVATSLITKAGWQWYQYYYLLIGGAVIESVVLISTFWKATGAVFRADHGTTTEEDDRNNDNNNNSDENSRTSTPTHHLTAHPAHDDQSPKVPWYTRINPLTNPRSRTAEALRNRVTILTALFLLIYVGAEVTLGGWIVTFMLRVRSGTPFASGLTSTGFWLGITVGRLVLGFVTARFFKTEKHAVATYLVVCMGLQLLFWLVPHFVVSAVAVGLLGFFLGPMFPAAVVALTKLLPKRLHVASIGFAAALGASGACIFPFATGAIANARGVAVLEPIALALIVVSWVIWLLIPKLPKQRTQ